MGTMPRMRVVHASAGRLRLRTADHDGADPAFFARLRERLGEHEAVTEVRTSARTGGVLLLFVGELAPLLDWIARLDLIAVERPGHATPLLRIKRALEESEGLLADRTRGVITPGTLGFLAMVTAAAVQLRGGYFLPSAFSLLESALKALNHEAEREREASQARP